MLNFYHTYLYFKDKIRTYFCEIYVYFIGFFSSQKDKFSIPKKLDLAVCRSTGRSTGSGVGRPDWLIDVHANVHMASLKGRSTARSTD